MQSSFITIFANSFNIIMGLFDKLFKRNKVQEEAKETLDKGLEKTKDSFFSKITKAIAGKSEVDVEVLDNLEEALMTSDVGVATTVEIIKRIEERVAKDKYLGTKELNSILQEEMVNVLTDAPSQEYQNFDLPADHKPHIILVVGVNGVGKTTTIGKLAYNFKNTGKKVVLGAADTFRAAAVDQLTIWSERVGVDIIKKEMGSDPASVAFDSVNSAIARQADVLIIDTAGRLHNKIHLMDELNKIKRVIQKVIPNAPHEVLLVLDGSTGQNALEQAKQFTQTTDVSSLAITKLDGTAKGGVVLAIAHQFKIPVKYIGVGEQMQDLQIFNKYEFVDSLFRLK
ncbi:MAG TPA: signal recognition particle-docking protein FtsY [Chitinophagaceae bacterium]|nr:signal recognition particle-docking protein FtsY [Chitinophagaceae bacterium]